MLVPVDNKCGWSGVTDRGAKEVGKKTESGKHKMIITE